MTVFADFLDLRTAVLEEAKRTDLADVFPRLVALAEGAFSRRLRLREQMTSTTLTIASGSVALPTDLVAINGVYNANGCEYVQQPIHAVKPSGYFYAVDGVNLVTSTLTGDVLVDYFAKIPTITASMTSSNWLLQRYPEIYLYGVAFELSKHIRDKEAAADNLGLLRAAYDDAEADDEQIRYSRARVRVQGVTP